MSTSENEKARAEALSDVPVRRSPGRYESEIARALTGLVYAVSRVREERRSAKSTDDESAPESGEK